MIYSNFIFYNEQLIDMCGLLKKCPTRGKQSNANHALIRDGSRFSNIRLVYLIIEYRLGCAIIF